MSPPLWLVVPGVLLAALVVASLLPIAADDSQGDTLSEVGSSALLLVFVPVGLAVAVWLGAALVVYSHGLEPGRRRARLHIAGVVALLVGLSPVIITAVAAAVWVLQGRPEWSP